MYHIKEDSIEELEIKKSRFLCYLHRIEDEEDAKSFLMKIKKEHPNATHHCYAFICGDQNETQRSNDDGEPSGTAGAPMLDVLQKAHMQDIIAITVRYFGGIKLGAGGLIRAYSKSVSTALANTTFTKKQRMLQYSLHFSYDLIGKMDYYFRQKQMEILVKEYNEDVHYIYLSAEDITSDISELTNGIYLPIFMDEVSIDVDVPKK